MYGAQPLNLAFVAAVATPQYKFALASGENYVGPAVSAVQANIGITQGSAGVGESVTVCLVGVSRCYVSSAVAFGAGVTSSTGGGAVTAASGDMVNGIALQVGAPGDLIPVLVTPPWKLG